MRFGLAITGALLVVLFCMPAWYTCMAMGYVCMTHKTMSEIRDSAAEKALHHARRLSPNEKDIWCAGFDCRDKLDNEALKVAIEFLKAKVLEHKQSYGIDIFPNSITIDDNSPRDSISAKWEDTCAIVFISYIEEALAKIRVRGDK